MTTSEMKQKRNYCKTAVIGSKIYCFSCQYLLCSQSSNRRAILNSSEVYCRKSDTWSLIAPFRGSCLEYCCVCSFMNKIYVFGDLWGNNWVYDPAENNWNSLTDCIVKRHNASCTVFEGQCVVVGGKDSESRDILKSVEAYDHYLKKWSIFAEMQTKKYKASVVTKGNKLFVLAGCFEVKCEVYDSISKRFSYIDRCYIGNMLTRNPMIFGNFIVIYDGHTVYKYHIEKDRWSERHYGYLNEELPFNCSCVKINKILT